MPTVDRRPKRLFISVWDADGENILCESLEVHEFTYERTRDFIPLQFEGGRDTIIPTDLHITLEATRYASGH